MSCKYVDVAVHVGVVTAELGFRVGDQEGELAFHVALVLTLQVHANAFFISSSLTSYSAAVRLRVEAPEKGLLILFSSLCTPHRKGWLLRKGLGSQ